MDESESEIAIRSGRAYRAPKILDDRAIQDIGPELNEWPLARPIPVQWVRTGVEPLQLLQVHGA